MCYYDYIINKGNAHIGKDIFASLQKGRLCISDFINYSSKLRSYAWVCGLGKKVPNPCEMRRGCGPVGKALQKMSFLLVGGVKNI
jgi:hypothetical protein